MQIEMNQSQKGVSINEQMASNSEKVSIINQNGFSRLPTLQQILPIVYTLYMFAEVIIIINKMESSIAKISIGVSYGIIFLMCFYLWFITTKVDPTDTIQMKHRASAELQIEFKVAEYRYYCNLCQTCVSKNAFHCKKCNRCVQVFDHHCKWLNNCIGAKNYFEFYGLVVCTELLLLYHIVLNSVSTSILFKIEQNQTLDWFAYVQLTTIVVDLVILCLNSLLLGMHTYLITQKKTTLELIREMRGKNKIHPSACQNINSEQGQNKSSKVQDIQLSEEKLSKSQSEFIKKKKLKAKIIKQRNSSRDSSQGLVKNTKKLSFIEEKKILEPTHEKVKLAPLKLMKFQRK